MKTPTLFLAGVSRRASGLCFCLVLTATSLAHAGVIATDASVPVGMNAGGSVGDLAEYIIGAVPGYSQNFNSGVPTNLFVGSVNNGAFPANYNALTIQSGGSLTNTVANIGFGSTSNATLGGHNEVTVTGIGSIWQNTGTLNVGLNASDNALTVEAGGTVTSTRGVIGTGRSSNAALGSNNQATVIGTGSSWTMSSGLTVGSFGSGNSLTIAAGGTVTTAAITSTIGNAAIASNNQVTVTGAGSAWYNSHNLNIGALGSNNTLSIEAGGAVTSVAAIIGSGSDGNATVGRDNRVTVTGAGSSWVTSSALAVGFQGQSNTLTVSAGGSVHAMGNFSIGYGSLNAVSGQSNAVLVTGTGSSLVLDAALSIGSYSASGNTLTIQDAGLVNLTGQVNLPDPAKTMTVGADTTVGANLLRVSRGYFAWAGDHVSDLLLLAGSGSVQYEDSSGWITATPADLTNGNVTITHYATAEAASAATGGFYTFVGDYTILTAVPEPATTGIALAALLGGLILLRRRAIP